ncbi:M28 family peptidase [Acidisphaera sp. L21]|uniref:M28 family peptidase n=1 Tax=Acidisphaera sp. L21 TaxID=1641851 RepID=UPI00131E47CC|nr:M28 family peptidase [Acidisphaera sp. L21]
MDIATFEPANQVDRDRLMGHCQDFARWVKLSGSPDELASMKEVQAKIANYGYRTKLILHDAYISLPGTARVVVDGVDLTAITHSFSRPSPEGGLSAPLAYLGEGTDVDFAGRDVRGCIVMVEGIASPAVAVRAARAGAVGQLHISPHEHLHEMCISPVWGSPSLQTLGDLPTTVTCTISDADGGKLRDRLAAGEAPAVTLHATVDTGWRKTPILQADLDGPEPNGPFVLFSGHHDTWYYGVMDNGSANATMLETARLLALGQQSWRRGVRFCFWSGHSHGRYSGSAWYVDNHWAELERRCAVHVNVDSTGGIGASVMTEGAVASELAALAAGVVKAETNAEHEGRRVGRNSDMSFWGVGIPTLFGSLSHQPPSPVKMRNPLGWWWHTPHDLLDKIDPDNLARDTRVFVSALWRLVTDARLPMNYDDHATALQAELGKLTAALGDRMDLSDLVAATTALQRTAAAVKGEDTAVNNALMAASRALVPVDYTAGDRFSHDPALPQKPWPVMEPIRTLAAAKSNDDIRFARVEAVRARNRMVNAVQAATRALAKVA